MKTEKKRSEDNERRILGIDPGFGRMGYAVISAAGSDLHLLVCDAIMTPTGQAYPLRLQLIYEDLSVIIARYHPQEAAIEKLFFGKNVTTAIGVAQASGVVLLTLVQSGLTIAEYTPSEIKLAVTGYGAARKEQVGYMVQHMLDLPSIPRPDAAADAAAIAICHAHVLRIPTEGLQEVSHCCTQGWLFSEKLSFLRFGDMVRLGMAGAKQSEVVKELILLGNFPWIRSWYTPSKERLSTSRSKNVWPNSMIRSLQPSKALSRHSLCSLLPQHHSRNMGMSIFPQRGMIPFVSSHRIKSPTWI